MGGRDTETPLVRGRGFISISPKIHENTGFATTGEYNILYNPINGGKDTAKQYH